MKRGAMAPWSGGRRPENRKTEHKGQEVGCYVGHVPNRSEWRSMRASSSTCESRLPSSVAWFFHMRTTAPGPANLKRLTASAWRRKWASNAAQWIVSDGLTASPFSVLIVGEAEQWFCG